MLEHKKISQLNDFFQPLNSRRGKGVYFYVDNSNAAEKALRKEMDKLAKADIETTVYTEYDEQFAIIAWMILIVLLVEILVCDSRNPRLKKFNLFKTDVER